jgi:type I restriction enzyme S subunit
MVSAMIKRRLKPGWQTWCFDQMAVIVNDRIDDPSKAGVERYVGLEHLDPASLRIHRWGSPSDVEATKLIFRKGDIIFGRRRAYQRKLAVADFDGICSAHAMVLRARPDVVLPEFLPFFMQSDLFMNRAQEISVGSLSPTINWKTLAAQEFALPPLEEQRRMAQLLAAIEVLIEHQLDLQTTSRSTKQSVLRELFERASKNATAQTSHLGQVGSWESGGTPSKANPRYWETGSIPWITPKDVIASHLSDSQDHVTEFALSDGRASLHPPGTFVVVWRSGILRHSLPTALVECSYTINQDMKVFRPVDESVKSEYVHHYVQTFSEDIRRRSVKSGTTVESISTSSFLDYPIPVPSAEMQSDIIDVAHKFGISMRLEDSRLEEVRNLKKALLEELI